MISILVRYGFRWHSDKPYRTHLRLVRYGLSACQLNPYRTRMDTICISYCADVMSVGGSSRYILMVSECWSHVFIIWMPWSQNLRVNL